MTNPSPQNNPTANTPFQGSYTAEDCLFLLTPIQAQFQSIENKEQLIQSGQLHYSEMVSQETAPSAEYTELFLQLTARYQHRLASEVLALAKMISAQHPRGNIALLSLARAGTPIGVLVQRALRDRLGRTSSHYSLSIIRDKGIDTNALDYVLKQGFAPENCVFIDGWTAKGVITRELHRSIDNYNQQRGVQLPKALYVISDIGGTADVQATFDDYTIPSALMNSTVSGLVSRSILNHHIGEHDFHGCVHYAHLADHDLSRWFVDEITQAMQAIDLHTLDTTVKDTTKAERQAHTHAFLSMAQAKYGISDINRIKPGIAEATRALLRRVPDMLLLKQTGHTDTQHLEQLAQEKSVPIAIEADMPFGACSLIKDVTQKG